MAEETSEGTTTPSVGLSEEKLAELIKANVDTSMKDALANLRAEQESYTTQTKESETSPTIEGNDFWDGVISRRVDGKVKQANLQAEIAQDKIDFYTSEQWLEEADEWLTEEDPAKRKAEKKALREDIEKAFNGLVQNGRGMPRADIFKAVLGEKITKDRAKYVESIGRKKDKQRETELAQARRGVDISSGNITNFTPADIYKMDHAKLLETFGEVSF